MDERISSFIESLKKQLEGLPHEEIIEAVSYYEEYLSDAAEAGKDLDTILAQLGPPDKIAGMIRTETSIIRAQQSPGLRNFTSVLRNAFLGVTTPAAILLLSAFIVVSFSLVVVLFAGALAVFAGAIIIVVGFIYQAFSIPLRFPLEIVGTLGMGFFGAGICLLTAFWLYKLGILFIRISTQLVRWMLKKFGKHIPEMSRRQIERKSNSKRVVVACLVLSVTGLILFSISGLPVRYFIIFNSMKPENISMRTLDVEPDKINKISVVSAHSHVKLVRNSSDKITISYEQPDWLDYEMGSSGSMLSFYEKSNGRLPLFKLTTIHNSHTEIVVSIPQEYSPEIVTIESTGGYIYITGVAENVRVKTYTGNIYLDSDNSVGDYNIKVNTKSGCIDVDGIEAGQKTSEGTEYYLNTQSEKTIEFCSSRGNISIK